jgi:hypothetical protein
MLYRSPYGVGYLLEGWSVPVQVPKEDFRFTTSGPDDTPSTFKEIIACEHASESESGNELSGEPAEDEPFSTGTGQNKNDARAANGNRRR